MELPSGNGITFCEMKPSKLYSAKVYYVIHGTVSKPGLVDAKQTKNADRSTIQIELWGAKHRYETGHETRSSGAKT